MDPSVNKLGRVWTHTAGVFAFLAAVVTIISFLGFHPRADNSSRDSTANRPRAGTLAEQRQTASHTAGSEDSAGTTPGPYLKRRGVGTFHLGGGFDFGQPYISTNALAASDQPATITLKNASRSKEEAVPNTIILAPIDSNQPIGLWRQGSTFVRGLKGVHQITVAGNGYQSVHIPVSDNGSLLVNVVWPESRRFTDVSYDGPLQVDGFELGGGLTFADAGTSEAGKTLPTRFSVDLPKPTEVLSAFKGEFTFPGGADQPRYVIVQALSSGNQTVASWSARIAAPESTAVRTVKDAVFDRDLSSVKVLYSKDAG